jgi:hypothetical protein
MSSRIDAATLEQAGTACQIEDNISAKGERLYHVPGGEFYERIRIDPLKGKRWFCTGQEARAAGWRWSRQ